MQSFSSQETLSVLFFLRSVNIFLLEFHAHRVSSLIINGGKKKSSCSFFFLFLNESHQRDSIRIQVGGPVGNKDANNRRYTWPLATNVFIYFFFVNPFLIFSIILRHFTAFHTIISNILLKQFIVFNPYALIVLDHTAFSQYKIPGYACTAGCGGF